MRISIDGLPVAEVDDGQQGDNRSAHRNDVVHADQAERDEQRERGLRAIRGGTEGVKAEDGMPAMGPMCSARSSLVASGRPKRKV